MKVLSSFYDTSGKTPTRGILDPKLHYEKTSIKRCGFSYNFAEIQENPNLK